MTRLASTLAVAVRAGGWVQPLSAAGVVGIGAAAFLLSYDALHSLALASGVRPGLARIWPGVLDGFIVVATLTVVAAKRAAQPTWYPWTLVVLFSAASVAFNILHALDQTLAPAGWVAGLVFAMPPMALVLATHLLLQQSAWRRHHPLDAPDLAGHPQGVPRTPSADPRPGQPSDLAISAVTGTAGTPLAAAEPANGRDTEPPMASAPQRAPADQATRQQARQLYEQAQADGRRLTGAELGRALGTSDSYGRLLLREFRATTTTEPANGSSRTP